VVVKPPPPKPQPKPDSPKRLTNRFARSRDSE
jgi:hypothetical protein